MYASVLDEFASASEAIDLLQRARQTHPGNPTILNSLAYTLALEERDLPEAEQYVREALKQDPENAAFLDTLGWVLFKMGRPKDALPPLLRAIEQLPGDPEILDHLGDVMLALGRAEEAVQYWESAQKAAPDNALIRSKLDANRER
jgi:predicted Zn-dependent protease